MAHEQSWSVGTILREPLAVTLRFVAWYLEQGAASVTLVFDDPQDPALRYFEGHAQVNCVTCTPDFWADLGMAQETRFPKRQNAAMTWLYHQHSLGWFLNVDADEYLYRAQGSIGHLLADLPSDALSVRIATAESLVPAAPQSTTVFRLPMTRPQRRAVYGADAGLFGPRRQGLVGHPQGKSLIRSGREGLKLRQHWPEQPGVGRLPETFLDAASGCYLLHKIGLDYDVWRQKLSWRTGASGFSPGVAGRISEVMEGPDPEPALRDLYGRLHRVTPDMHATMQAENVSLEVALNLDGLVSKYFGLDLAK